MDVEIVKKNGRKFRLSDYGVVKDFVVDSIDREVVRDSVDGRPGSLEYGVYDGDRSISVPFILKAKDLHDYAHLRDELYSLLGDREPFYIREMRRPKTLQYDFVGFGQKPKWSSQTDNEYVNGKQYLVRLDNALSPSQKGIRGEVTLEFVTSGLPYAETTYTTLELHDSGYEATAEKYGLVDDIDDDKVKYRFKPDIIWNPNLVPFTESLWEDGSRWSTGSPTASSNGIRMIESSYIQVTPGQEYTLTDQSLASSNIGLWRIFEVNEDNSLTQRLYVDRNSGARSFVPTTDKVLLAADHSGSSNISKSFLNDGKIKVKLEEGGTFTGFTPKSESFTVYNAGNVTIEPESMYLNIGMRFVTTSGGFKLRNETTGEEHIINSAHERMHLRVNGMKVTSGNVNNFRNTNRRFISLVPGDNEFTVSGGAFEEITIDFKYLYK